MAKHRWTPEENRKVLEHILLDAYDIKRAFFLDEDDITVEAIKNKVSRLKSVEREKRRADERDTRD